MLNQQNVSSGNIIYEESVDRLILSSFQLPWSKDLHYHPLNCIYPWQWKQNRARSCNTIIIVKTTLTFMIQNAPSSLEYPNTVSNINMHSMISKSEDKDCDELGPIIELCKTDINIDIKITNSYICSNFYRKNLYQKYLCTL